MPVRIYTSSPASQLLDERPFGIVAWSEGPEALLGEAYVITYPRTGEPHQRGARFPLTSAEFEESIERRMRIQLETVWAETPAARELPFEALAEEIPAAEFAVSQMEKPAIAALARKIAQETRCDDLSVALASFLADR